MNVFLVVVLFVLGLFFIIKGGDFLVNAALRLNKATGISQIVIGATFIAVATTLPEVFVSVVAVMAGNHSIAVGNALGSMIANIALVLGIFIFCRPGTVPRKSAVWKSVFLLIAMVVVWLFASNLRISWVEGLVLLIGFGAFLFFNIWEAGQVGNRKPNVEREVLCKGCKRKHLWFIMLGFVVGQALLMLGAWLLVVNGERLAHLMNISETVIGFTLIAVGTTLPELVTVIKSIAKRSGGLAIGNVLGANVITCTLLLGASSVIGGYLPISQDTLFISIPVLLAVSLVAIIPILVKARSYRWQGALLLTLYFAYLVYLMIAQPV